MSVDSEATTRSLRPWYMRIFWPKFGWALYENGRWCCRRLTYFADGTHD
jgi:hypothetical protein